jgi:hypothetical protein
MIAKSMTKTTLAAGMGLFFSHATLTANAATTDVMNILDPTVNTYQQQSNAVCNNLTCQVTFPAITAQRLLILHVSCATYTLGSPSWITGYVTTGTTNSFNYIPMIQMGTELTTGLNLSISNADVYFFASTNEIPLVKIQAVAVPIISADCTLTGYFR